MTRLNPTRLPLLAVLATALLVAPATAADWKGEVVEKDGVKHVMNPAEPVAKRTITPEPVFSLGGDSESDDEFFGFVSDLLVDEQGNFYVLDTQLSEIKVYDNAGNYLRTIGREGEGPGEFRGGLGMFWHTAGHVVVQQAFPSKMIVLTREGEPAGELQVPADPKGGFRVLFGAELAGDQLAMIYANNKPSQQGFTQENVLALVDMEGNEKAQLFHHSSTMEAANATISELQWDSFRNRWSANDVGMVYAAKDISKYEITAWKPDGTVSHVIHREYAPHKRSAEELEFTENIYRGFTRQIPLPDVKYEIEETHPPIGNGGIHTRDDGSVWVLSSRGADVDDDRIGIFDVFDAEGRFVEQVTLVGECDNQMDGIYFLDDYVVVITDFLAAAMGAQGGDFASETGVEPEPVSVNVYRLGGLKVGMN